MTRKALNALRKIASETEDTLNAHFDAVERAKYRMQQTNAPRYNSYTYQQRPEELIVGHGQRLSAPAQIGGTFTHPDYTHSYSDNNTPQQQQQTQPSTTVELPKPDNSGGFGIGHALAGLGIIGGAAYAGSKLLPDTPVNDNVQETPTAADDPEQLTDEDRLVDTLSTVAWPTALLGAWAAKKYTWPLLTRAAKVVGPKAVTATKAIWPAAKALAAGTATAGVIVPVAAAAAAGAGAPGMVKLVEANPEAAKQQVEDMKRRQLQYPGSPFMGGAGQDLNWGAGF